MTDYVIIEPGGELIEGEGYPADLVGCHGYSGQTLHKTRRYLTSGMPSTLRMIACDCSLAMREGHADNPIARAVLLGLGYSHQVRGKLAIVRVDWQNEPIPLTPGDLSHLRNLTAAGRAVEKLRTPDPPAESVSGVYVASVGDDGTIHLDPAPATRFDDPDGDASR